MVNKSSTRGFTIVELLIVIVVIGILAAISIVAYNGVQQRAKLGAVLSTVSVVIRKSEAVNAVTGQYPASATDFNLNNETKLDGTKIVFISPTLPDANSSPLTVQYRSCGDGVKIVYWDYIANAVTNKIAGNLTQTCSLVAGGPF